MKKFLAVLFAVALLASLCLTVSAANDINANEKAVLDKLKSVVSLGAGGTYAIPAGYVNAAENYFLTCDMTEAQKATIMGYIDQGVNTIKSEAARLNVTGEEFKLSSMSGAARSAVLSAGQEACQTLDLTLVYEAAANKVTITAPSAATPLFSSTPLVKATGEGFTMNAAIVGAVIAVAVLGSTAVLFVTSKKNGLLVK